MTALEARNNAISYIRWYDKNISLMKSLLNDNNIVGASEDLKQTLETLYNISNKENPMKPREQKLLGIRHNCPMCDYVIVSHARYCSNCGQRIDWERT